MSPAPAPSPPVWLCSRCGYKPFTGGSGAMAAHLIEEHGLPAMDALREARGPAEPPPAPATAVGVLTKLLGPEHPAVVNEINRGAPPPTKETPMPTGVYPRTSDPTKRCGRCKRPKDDHTANCPRRPSATGAKKPKPATARKPGRPKKTAGPVAVPTNGSDPIATIRAVRIALDQFEAELASLREFKAAMARMLGA